MTFVEILSIAAQMILCLSLLVILHECGHFFPARWFKTRVEKFYLFFDPYFSLFKKKIGETEYGIGWIPFGGYVKISGMIDESMDKEQMEGPPQPWEFRSKKAWQRLIIMVGGVFVNFILGFFIFAMLLFVYGKSYYKTQDLTYGIAVDSLGIELGLQDGDNIIAVGNSTMDRYNSGKFVNEIILNNANQITVLRGNQEQVIEVAATAPGMLTSSDNKGKKLFYPRFPQKIESVNDESLASDLGLQPEDQILTVNGQPTTYFQQIKKVLPQYRGQDINLEVLRGADTITMNGRLNEDGKLGVYFYNEDHFLTTSRDKYGFFESLPAGVNEGVSFLSNQIKAFSQIFKGKIKASDSLGSVFSIASLFDPAWDWEKFWKITAMLSIILGFFNILPIPALDGGYVMFLFYEMITGRKPNDKFMEYVTIAGFIILVGLMIFALGLDVTRLFK